MTTAHPLHWPSGKQRCNRPTRSRFSVSFVDARSGVIEEIRLLGGTLPVISTNIELRRDGLPYAGKAEPYDSGVAVYFQMEDQPMCFACDRWDLVKDNLQAIRHTIAALRGIERWGTSEMVNQAFCGFVALPNPSSAETVLGVSSTASRSEIEAAFRRRAKTAHPDCGGSHEQMQALVEARAAMMSHLEAVSQSNSVQST